MSRNGKFDVFRYIGSGKFDRIGRWFRGGRNSRRAGRRPRKHVDATNLSLESLEDRVMLSVNVYSDLADYQPGETAFITATGFTSEAVEFQVLHVTDPGADGIWGTLDDTLGDNSGAGHVPWFVSDGGVNDLDGTVNGIIETSWYVTPDDSLGEVFLLAAEGVAAGPDGSFGTSDDVYNGEVASNVFTDGQQSLWAWRTEGPNANSWLSGTTIQQANSIYAEDDVIPFRWTIKNGNPAPKLQEGVTYTVRLDWDFAGGTTDPNKFMIDYLTTWNATEATATGPFSDLSGFTGGNLSTTAIATDPQLQAGVQTAGVFTLYNIDASSFQYVSGTASDRYVEVLFNSSQTRKHIDVTFTPNDGDGTPDEFLNVGIAWGGHLAAESDYGLNKGANNFPGSSPQMIVDLSPMVSGDTTNLNLSPSAIVQQGKITIVKDAQPNALQDFSFTTTSTATSLPSTFTLDDDSGVAGGDATYSNQVIFFGLAEGTYTFTENSVSGWTLTSLTAAETGAEDTTTGDISSTDLGARTLTITLANGEFWTGTFTNTQSMVTTVTLDDVTVNEDETITYTASVDNAPVGAFSVTLDNGVVINFADGSLTGSSAPQPAQGEDPYLDGESFTVSITSTSGGGYGTLDTTDTALVTIDDTIDDTTVDLSASTVFEGAVANYTFTATLSNASQGTTTITTDQGVITILDGETTGTLVIASSNDEDPYLDASNLTANITGASGGNFENLVVGTSSATATVNDTIDTTTVTIDDVTVDEGTGTATISASVDSPVTGSDLVLTLDNGETITIAVGETTGTSTPFAIQGDDPYVDGESFTVAVDSTSGGNFEAVDTTDDALVTINDTIDTTTVTLNDAETHIPTGQSGDVTITASVDFAVTESDLVITLDNGETITIAVGETTGETTFAVLGGVDYTFAIDSSSGGNYEDIDTSDDMMVTAVNDVPTIDEVTLVNGGEIYENSPAGTPVGQIVASDGDGDPLTYVSDDPRFEIDSEGNITVAAGADIDYETETSITFNVTVSDEYGGVVVQEVTIGVLNVTATISGTVFVDVNGNNLFDATETGIDGVGIELRDDSGTLLSTDYTSMNGVYGFVVNDEFGTYTITEIQPTGVDDGTAILGDNNADEVTGDGNYISSNEMEVTLNGVNNAENYDFTEIGQTELSSGDTATIGFWQNGNGQRLIKQADTSLAQWLTENFGNIFGTTFVTDDGGTPMDPSDDSYATSDVVAGFYKKEFFKKKFHGTPKVDAQFMAVAFAVYFTDSGLSGGADASGYGFNVTDTGIGTNVVNVGSSGDAFGVANDSNMTIMALLLATNDLTADLGDENGGDYNNVYDRNGDGILDEDELALRVQANELYTWINETGDRP